MAWGNSCLSFRLCGHPERVAERSESSNEYDCRWQSYLDLCEARRRIPIDTAESLKMGILRHCVPQNDTEFDGALSWNLPVKGFKNGR